MKYRITIPSPKCTVEADSRKEAVEMVWKDYIKWCQELLESGDVHRIPMLCTSKEESTMEKLDEIAKRKYRPITQTM